MKLRSFVLGMVAGSLLAGTVSAAANNQVEAFLKDDFKIYIDGEELVLNPQEGFHTLFYDNRVYTPVRPIAEAMGASVAGDSELVTIAVPTPTPAPTPRPTPTPTATPPTATPTPTPTPTPAARYNPYPVHMSRSDVSVEVTEMSTDRVYTSLQLDYENNNGTYPILLDFDKTYLEIDGKKFPVVKGGSNQIWANSLSENSAESYLDMVFQGDAGEKKKVTANIVFIQQQSLYGREDRQLEFKMNIDFTDDDD